MTDAALSGKENRGLRHMLMYIDPGAGSMIVQALAGGLAGLAVVLKLYWGRVKRALRFGRRGEVTDERAA